MRDAIKTNRTGALLDVLLGGALIVLVHQLFPSLFTTLLWAIDIRNWPRTVWFAVNWIVLFALVGIRFGPDLYQEWRNRRKRRTAKQREADKHLAAKEHRESLERIQQSRSRRMY